MHKIFILCLCLVAITVSQPWINQTPPPPEPEIDSSQIIADKITASKIPVLIDFWAVWCRPCRMLGPTIEELKNKYGGKIMVMKVNVDANRALSAYFRIQAIPAVFIISNKAVVDVIQGLQPPEVYENAIKKAISSTSGPANDSAKSTPPQVPSSKPSQTKNAKTK